MEQQGYTKGEWILEQAQLRAFVIACGVKNIAKTSQATRIEDAGEVAANANLISASPDMYEALKAVNADILECGYVHGKTIMLFHKALAKADGKND